MRARIVGAGGLYSGPRPIRAPPLGGRPTRRAPHLWTVAQRARRRAAPRHGGRGAITVERATAGTRTQVGEPSPAADRGTGLASHPLALGHRTEVVRPAACASVHP